MFLDPEPKVKADRPPSRSSPFFASQTPVLSPRDEWLNRRKALSQRTASQLNEQPAKGLLRKRSSKSRRTVRLVKGNPSPASSIHKVSFEENDNTRNVLSGEKLPAADVHEAQQSLESLSADVKPTSASEPGFPADSRVSDAQSNINPARKLDFPSNVLLSPPAYTQVLPKTAWHRRSTSSKFSASSTLQGTEVGDTSFTGSESSRAERFSQGTTLRGTPTPYERDPSESFVDEDVGSSPQGPHQALETLEEVSPERSTVRAVQSSSPSTPHWHLRHELHSSPSKLPRPHTPPNFSSPNVEVHSSLEEHLSTYSPSAIVRPQRASRVTPAQTPSESPNSTPTAPPSLASAQQSSPNVVVYVDASRPLTRSQLIRSVTSFESILSRHEAASNLRPDTGRSGTTNASWASHQRSSSADTLPPLQVPKKRLRHTRGSISGGAPDSMYDDFDPLPWPRQPLRSHLSTIASESDRSNSRQLSHFSLGSGVLTGDDASSIPLSSYRRGSAPMTSPSSESPVRRNTGSEEEMGDMTMGVFRAESAKPEPLFRGRTCDEQEGTRRYDGPLPPMPPMPNESDENVDTIGELTRPPLREKRSGYSIRQRSNSTPSGSHSRQNSRISTTESERWSHGSSIFPVWAKNFYVHNAQLLSASKISLSGPPTPRPREANLTTHARNASQWTERSITSRLGTGYSELESSPTSSHFLPSIFRPRTRTRAKSEGSSKNKLRKSKASRPSAGDSIRPDSLAIFEEGQNAGDEMLPSGQPKWGTLQDPDAPPMPPLPRKYSKQRHWDDMTFPRPMTKDRLSEFSLEASPHLQPNRRTGNRLSTWRAPSFVESLDTLIHSRGNRQILLFAIGFLCPFAWMLGAILPLPERPARDQEKAMRSSVTVESEVDEMEGALRRHTAGEASRRWTEERLWMKARWWRTLNRIMAVVGVGVIAAVIALAIVATRR
nr:hypothetical protein B0A51_16750 [Rachicladosporium sp. CCFEE 5018]